MAASAATLVFLLSLICIPSRFITGALPAPTPTVAEAATPPPATPPPATPSKPVTPPPATPPKRVPPPPATPSKPTSPPPETPSPPKSVSPPPATPSKPVLPPTAAPPKLGRPRPATPPKSASPPTKAPPTKPVLPPRAAPPMPALSPLLAPIPWDQPGYKQAKPVPEPVRKACLRTLFPDLCGRVLGFAVDPQRANDTRHLAEASARAAIQAGTALANFGYVYIAGAKNGTRLVLCVRDCTIRIDAAVKNMTASVAAMKKGARAQAGQLAGDAAKGIGVCWGSCARFTGEAMVVMIKRARQFERLVMIAGSIILMII